MSKLDFSSQAEPYSPQQALRDSAARLRLSPEDLATAIAYETGGSFDPWQKGPVTKWGEHRGLIQWGEPQRQQYGVGPDTPFQEQVMKAEKYFLDRGFRPGEHGLRDLYSTINAGSPGRYGASDRPGYTVDRHVQEMEGYRGRAQTFLSNDQQIIEPASQLAQYEPVPGGLDFSSQAEPVQNYDTVSPGLRQTYDPIPGGLDFSSQAEDVAPEVPPPGQLELPLGGETGGVAPVGEGRPGSSPTVPTAPAQVPEEEQGGLFDWFWRSKYQYETRNVMIDVLNGSKDIPTAAGEFAALVEKQKAVPERQKYTEGAQAMARYEKGLAPEYEGIKGWFKFFYDHPTYALEAIGESGFQTGEALVMGAAGAAVGAPLGPAGMATGLALGVGTSSGLSEGINKYMESLQDLGVDVASEESLQGAFSNPEIIAEARDKAIKKGAVVGVIDGFTAMLGARGLGKPIAESIGTVLGSQAAKKGATRKAIEESAAELIFLEAPGGMAGEAFGELAAEGEINNPISVLMEGFGEIVLGGPQVALQTAIAQSGREAAVADAGRIKEVVTAITEVPSYETAVTEGRDWFGFAEQGNFENVVHKNYTAAEETMARTDPRKGKLVAATENDVTATFVDARSQVQNTKNPAAPTFVIPEREAQARAAWDSFVNSPTPTKDAYKAAVAEGVRLTPREQTALFVGDMTANEILPKSELVIRNDAFDVRATDPTTGQPATSTFKIAENLNSISLMEDDRFTVRLTPDATRKLQAHPEAVKLAPSLLEVKDPAWETVVNTQGWGAFIDSLAKLSDAELKEAFEAGKIKLRPSMGWNVYWGIPLVVDSKLPRAETEAALKTHESLIPDPSIQGPSSVDQTPKLATIEPGGYYDIEVAAPVPAGQVSLHLGLGLDPAVTNIAQGWADTAQRIMKTLGIDKRLIVVVGKYDASGMDTQFKADPGVWSGFVRDTVYSSGFMTKNRKGDVILWLPANKSPNHFYHTWAHEFGHGLAFWSLSALDPKHQAQLYAAYRRHVLVYRRGKESQYQQARGTSALNPFTPDDYYKSFEEWFAEQVARWGSSSAKPLGRVAKFFRKVAKDIVFALREFHKFWGDAGKAEPVIQDWLDAVYMGRPWSPGVRETLIEKTRAENAKHGVNIPLQAESVKTGQVLATFHSGAPPSNAATPGNHTLGAIRAQFDKFNWLMKWGFGYHQVAQENMHIPEVQLYTEGMRMSRLDVNNIMADAERILKQFMRPLRRQKTKGKSQADRLADFLFDMTEMNYRTQDEVNKGVRRNPSAQEFQRLVAKHQLSAEAVTTFEQIREFFIKVILRGEEVAISEANITFAQDPVQLQIAIARTKMMTRNLLSSPYFPMSRFGGWAVTIRTATGGVERFETFETKRQQQEAFAEAKRQYPESAGWSVRASVLPDDVKGFAGMPPWFLDRLQTMPGMTPTQVEWMKLLRYQVSPARSFTKHLIPRKKTQGYSRDMERVFAKYAFSHARNYGRVKYQRFLEQQIKHLRGEVFQPGHGDVNTRSRMANFLKDHFDEVMNPLSDWHFLRSATSVWYLGFMPSSAALNMTQTFLMTAPFLGSKFGDVKAMASMTKAAGQLSTYYKRGSYEGQTAAHMKMLDFLIKRGDVTESMAAELAGLASGNVLDSYLGIGETAHRAWLGFADKAMLMFKMVEQWNRRVAARAGFDLAMANPNNDYVQNMKVKYYLQYQRMLQEGFGTETEILATLAAGDTILSTHYDYSKEARPKFMRGKAGLIFAFYMFTQNTIFQLSSRENKGLFIRYALIMTLISGAMGVLPDDAEDILQFIGKKYFGKDFNLRLQARMLVNDLTNDEKLTDMVLHGTGRYSFGIPHLIESLGGPSLPDIDMSRLVELRHLAPLPLTRGFDVLSKSRDTEREISRLTEDLAGAGYSLPFAWLHALGDTELDWGDPKRWEKAVPRAAGKLMGAWRRFSEEGHRVGRSNMVLEYDTSDPADVAAIVAQGMGFTPTREALSWDLSSAQREVTMFWSAQRQALLARAYEAKLGKWKDEAMWKEALQAIKNFNKEVPDPSLRIVPDSVKKSFKARQQTQHEFLYGEGPNTPEALGREIRSQFPQIQRVREQKVKLGFGTKRQP
jgi:hypothetical protein